MPLGIVTLISIRATAISNNTYLLFYNKLPPCVPLVVITIVITELVRHTIILIQLVKSERVHCESLAPTLMMAIGPQTLRPSPPHLELEVEQAGLAAAVAMAQPQLPQVAEADPLTAKVVAHRIL